MMDQFSPPHGRGKKLKHSAAIRIALWLYPEAKPATQAERICTGICAIGILGLLVWILYFALQASSAGAREMILVLLIMPAGISLLLLGDWVGDRSLRNSRVWGQFYKEGGVARFAKRMLRRLARLFGVTPLLIGGLLVGLCGRLKRREISLEHTGQLLPIWLHRSISPEQEWQLYDSEIARLDDWTTTRGPLRVYIRTNLGREFCTTPSAYWMIVQSADQLSTQAGRLDS